MSTVAVPTENVHTPHRRSPFVAIACHVARWAVVALALPVGAALGGALAMALGMQMPTMPGQGEATGGSALSALTPLMLCLCIVPIARSLRGGLAARWLCLVAFVYVALGVNTAIEASIFTTYGGMGAMLVVFLPAVFLVALLAAKLFPGTNAELGVVSAVRDWLASRTGLAWVWRLPLAFLAFPLVYYTFGLVLVQSCPWVLDYYRSTDGGLIIPEPTTVIGTQLVRSALFLLSVVPIIATWAGSRCAFMMVIGLAYWVFVGLFGLVSATWWPAELRVAHSIEILADSLVYAWALAMLLLPPPAAARARA